MTPDNNGQIEQNISSPEAHFLTARMHRSASPTLGNVLTGKITKLVFAKKNIFICTTELVVFPVELDRIIDGGKDW